MTTLQEEKEQYVQNKANEIHDYMQSKKLMTHSIATCDDRRWDYILHRMMPQVVTKLRELGIGTTSKVNFEVSDWSFTIL